MLKKILFPRKYIKGPGALNELPSLIKTFGSQGLILASPTAHKKVLPDSGMDLNGLALPVERFGGEYCEKELARLAAVIRERQVDVLVGMGDEKTIWF